MATSPRKQKQALHVWIGFLTPEGISKGWSDAWLDGFVKEESRLFAKDFWAQILEMTAMLSKGELDGWLVHHKRTSTRGVAGRAVSEARQKAREQRDSFVEFVEGLSELNTKGELSSVDVIEEVTQRVEVLEEETNDHIYRSAVVTFKDVWVHSLFVRLHAEGLLRWPRAHMTVSEVRRPPQAPTAILCSPDARRAPGNKGRPTIHEIVRKQRELPVGFFQGLQALLKAVTMPHEDITLAQRRCVQPFLVPRQAAITFGQYMQRIWTYSGQNAKHRILCGLIYLERLLTGGRQEGAVRMSTALLGVLGETSETYCTAGCGAVCGAAEGSKRKCPNRLKVGCRRAEGSSGCGHCGKALPKRTVLAEDEELRRICDRIHNGRRSIDVAPGGVEVAWIHGTWQQREEEWDVQSLTPPQRARMLFKAFADRTVCKKPGTHQFVRHEHDERPQSQTLAPLRVDQPCPGTAESDTAYDDCAKLRPTRGTALIADGCRLALTERSGLKMLLTAVLLATKQHDDTLRDNAAYAAIGGCHASEINRMEMSMLELLQFDLWVPPRFERHFSLAVHRFLEAYTDCELRPMSVVLWDSLAVHNVEGGRFLRHVSVAEQMLLDPSEVEDLAKVLTKYATQCEEDMLALKGVRADRMRADLAKEHDAERRRLIDKHFGTDFVAPSSSPQVSANDAMVIVEFARATRARVKATWKELRQWWFRKGLAPDGATAKLMDKSEQDLIPPAGFLSLQRWVGSPSEAEAREVQEAVRGCFGLEPPTECHCPLDQLEFDAQQGLLGVIAAYLQCNKRPVPTLAAEALEVNETPRSSFRHSLSSSASRSSSVASSVGDPSPGSSFHSPSVQAGGPARPAEARAPHSLAPIIALTASCDPEYPQDCSQAMLSPYQRVWENMKTVWRSVGGEKSLGPCTHRHPGAVVFPEPEPDAVVNAHTCTLRTAARTGPVIAG
eukprot:Hpha_TRINITY_DN15951_c4_g7::TRINITY_DN15951_c4_g7_i1::g.71888::m.71888